MASFKSTIKLLFISLTLYIGRRLLLEGRFKLSRKHVTLDLYWFEYVIHLFWIIQRARIDHFIQLMIITYTKKTANSLLHVHVYEFVLYNRQSVTSNNTKENIQTIHSLIIPVWNTIQHIYVHELALVLTWEDLKVQIKVQCDAT